MSLGKRRSRVSRAQLRPPKAIPVQAAHRAARQRSRLTRLVVVSLAVLVTAALVHGTGPPLTWRLGQRPAREVRVNVPKFQIRNQVKTNTERQAAADKVAPILVNDPTPLKDLVGRLGDLVDAVANADGFDDLPEAVRSSWKLSPAAFATLKAGTDPPERRDELHRQIDRAIAPWIRDGVLGYDTLPRHEEGSRVLAIRTADQTPDEAHTVARERVSPERLARLDGPIAEEFLAAFDDPQCGQVVLALIAEKVATTPTLRYEERATTQAREAARARVLDVYDTYSRGDVLVEQGQPITEEQLVLLRVEHETALAALGSDARVRRAAAILVLVAALFVLIGYYIHRHEPRIAHHLRHIAVLSGLVILTVGMVRLMALQAWGAELIPVAVAAMVLAIAYNPHFALMVTFALSILTCLALGLGLGEFLILMGGTAAGVLTLHDVRSRTKLIKVGATAAMGYFLLTWAVGLWQDQPLGLITTDSLWRAGWGLMAGFFLGGSLPFIENTFGIVTGISLLELGDISHPLLQKLVRRAPGTHNHSVTVAALAESAAERIGANALLVRVGAYFHDIGKMLKPQYFIENQAGAPNRHANLAPAMSTLIIIGHVKDGADLARQHNLPEPIIDLIEQHHGTTLVEYFYHEAHRRNGGHPDATAVLESAYRYPGPKPQTREAGILMIADSVESASRSLSDPAPARLESLVRELIDKRLHDGQFDECGLTLREISEIRDSLIKSLIGIYHGRVKYPEQRTA